MKGRQGVMMLAAVGLQACSLIPEHHAATPLPMLTASQMPAAQAAEHLARAQALQAQRLLVQAGDEYRAALQLQPDSREAATGLANVLGQSGQLRQAQALLQQLVTRYPQDAGLANNLGYALYLQGNYAQAVSVLTQAGQLEPANQRTQNNLRLAESALQRAVHEATQAVTPDPVPADAAPLPRQSGSQAGSQSGSQSEPTQEVAMAVSEQQEPIGRLARWADARVLPLQSSRAGTAPAHRTPLAMPLAMLRPPAAPGRHAVPVKSAQQGVLRLSLGLGVAGAYVAHPVPLAAVTPARVPVNLHLQMATTFPSALQLNWMVGRSDVRSTSAPTGRPRIAGSHAPG